MSPQNRSLIVGLAAPGLLWLATSVAPGQDMPPPRGPSPAPTFAALLLSNGTVVRGEIAEDPATGAFRLKASGGPVVYEKSRVLKAGGTVEELYRYRVEHLATNDPDERIKLARWCLTEKLPELAREQLLAVQAMCPDDAEVRRMLFNLGAAADRPSRVDPELRRTSAEAPSPLDPRVVSRVRKNYNALPEIFDLPPGEAVPRAGEFTKYVQPVLLQSCARCHDEKYAGPFQLVAIRNRRDAANPDVARANLDATLRLINPDDPSRSELLSAGLVPHGPSKNAVFSGPNDRQYQLIATWVKRLRLGQAAAARPGGEPVSRAGFSPTEPAAGDGFAADRAGRSPAPAPSAPSAIPGLDLMNAARAANPAPPARKVAQSFDESADFNANPDAEYPVPFAAGGSPIRPPAAMPKAPAPAPTAKVTPVGTDAVIVGPTDDRRQLPGMDKPLYPTSKGAGAAAGAGAENPPAPKAKPKIDNALLEKMMKTRNANP